MYQKMYDRKSNLTKEKSSIYMLVCESFCMRLEDKRMKIIF